MHYVSLNVYDCFAANNYSEGFVCVFCSIGIIFVFGTVGDQVGEA